MIALITMAATLLFLIGYIIGRCEQKKEMLKEQKQIDKANKELSAQREFDLYNENIKATLL